MDAPEVPHDDASLPPPPSRGVTPDAFPTSTCKFLKIQSFVFFSRNFNFYPSFHPCKNVAGTTHFASSLRLRSFARPTRTRRRDFTPIDLAVAIGWPKFGVSRDREKESLLSSDSPRVPKDERRIHSSSFEVKRIAVEKVRDKQYRCGDDEKRATVERVRFIGRRTYSHARIPLMRFDFLHSVCLSLKLSEKYKNNSLQQRRMFMFVVLLNV